MNNTATGNGTSNAFLTLADMDTYFFNKHKALSRKRTMLKKSDLNGESKWKRDKTLWEMEVQLSEIQFLRNDLKIQYGAHDGEEIQG